MSRVVVVTGAARGIGAAIAHAFAELGDEVVGLDLVEGENRNSRLRHLTVDVTNYDSVREAFGLLDRVDVLVNNAGIQRVGLVGDQAAGEWLMVLATHLHGSYFCSSCAIPRMHRGGAIVSIASTAAFLGLPGRSAYSAGKAGILGLTRVMAVELAARGIRANAVCPGFTRTALVQQGIDDGSLDPEWMMRRVPIGRMAEAEEIARAVCFLAGEESSYITGQALVIDGGWTVQGLVDKPGVDQ